MKTLNDHIVTTPEVRFGKPRIAGHRITVSDVAIWHERHGWSVAKICEEFGLTRADVHAALAYYFDHQNDIDAEIEQNQALAEEQRKAHPSLLKDRFGQRGDNA